MRVDTGCIVAFQLLWPMTFSMSEKSNRRSSGGGAVLVHPEGPGRIWLQSLP